VRPVRLACAAVPGSVVLIPVAAGAVDGARVADLLAALAVHEPLAREVLVVDDEQPVRSFTRDGLHVTVIPNPRRGRGIPTLGGTTAGTLAGLAWVAGERPGAWVLRLDGDALVIGPFADAVQAALDADPRAGLLGSCHRTCNGDVRDVCAIGAEVRRHRRAVWAWRRPPRRPWWIRPADPHVRSVLAAAARGGYRPGEHCMAAGCIISGPLVRALAARGWLADPRRWLGARLGDDMVLGAMTRACGLELRDLHAVFGVSHRGLPDTPQRLLDREFAIIHSVKNDPALAEDEIRAFFAAARAAPSDPAAAAAPGGDR
jgi:hypothetical protein